ncbi:hypothetical protein [Alteromonas gilva]|uniref:Uncharacterized protein n=1 Tax=Alteromonas gilva TaxID=2987522 RepID=A0ABT5L4W8_9ALTE|nr:hypothetical protein [Alteromonas gilva]MDC8832098.1 hypothetical protein [Alteromonas gilva]
MNIDTTLLVQIILSAMLILTIVGYYLGKKKTGKPLLTAISLGVSGIIPIVALVYLLVLLFKPDIAGSESS